MSKRAALVSLYVGFVLALAAGAGSASLFGAALVGVPAVACFTALPGQTGR